MAIAGLFGLLSAAAAHADCQPEPGNSRFAAIKGAPVNLRDGPDERDFKPRWELKRRNLPVEILRVRDSWRCIRLPDGVRGWVQETQLESRRYVMILGGDADYRAARREPADDASPVATLQGGVIGRLDRCPHEALAWCRVEFTQAGVTGWLRRSDLFGVYPEEIFPEVKPTDPKQP